MRSVYLPAMCVFVLLSLGLSGCRDPDKEELLKTVEGLQERNKVLSGQVDELKAQVTALKAENPEIRQEAKRIRDDLTKQHQSELAQLRQLHEEKVKKLEGDKADLQIAFGKATKEKLALQELDDAQRLLPDAEHTRFGIERLIWIVLLASSFAVLAIVGGKYHSLRGQLHRLVLQKASQLQEIEVNL